MVFWAQPTKPETRNTQKKRGPCTPVVARGSPGSLLRVIPTSPWQGFQEKTCPSPALVVTEGRVEQNWNGQGSCKCASHWPSPEVQTQNWTQEFLTSTAGGHLRQGPGLSQVRGPSRRSRVRSQIPPQQLHGKREPAMDILRWQYQILTLESESLLLKTRLRHTRSSIVVAKAPHHKRAQLICQCCEVWLNTCFCPEETHTAFNFCLWH